MSIAPKVISELADITFKVLDGRYSGSFEEACGFVQDLLDTVDKAKLKFSEIVACRSVVLREDIQGKFRLEQNMYDSQGPLTPEQILNLIRYEPGISSQDWCRHMVEAGSVQVVKQ